MVSAIQCRSRAECKEGQECVKDILQNFVTTTAERRIASLNTSKH
jgi:hypothetical protein